MISDLSSPEYWESDEIDIRLNPRRKIDASGLREFLEAECGIRSAVVMTTSGSTGGFKFVVLPKAALLASARAVAKHCDLRKEDIWLAGLSDFHVGGLGIFARAYLVGSRVESATDRHWQRDGKPFLAAVDDARASLTSLTPTHLHDLVEARAVAPASLRGVLLGGGPIDPALVDRATALGWKTWPSYGMTEASSQIATNTEGESEWLPVLPHWECRTSIEEQLEIRGESLFAGYAVKKDGEWRFASERDEDGWFVTGDRCEIVGRKLRFLGRADDSVKISGELVSLSAIDELVRTRAVAMGLFAAVIAVPGSRRGNDLVAVVEKGDLDAERFLDDLNQGLEGIEQLSRVILVDRIPRTEIGKTDRKALRELAVSEEN